VGIILDFIKDIVMEETILKGIIREGINLKDIIMVETNLKGIIMEEIILDVGITLAITFLLKRML
jgi:hypothetical protein